VEDGVSDGTIQCLCFFQRWSIVCMITSFAETCPECNDVKMDAGYSDDHTPDIISSLYNLVHFRS
jgi:hypothetical protein